MNPVVILLIIGLVVGWVLGYYAGTWASILILVCVVFSASLLYALVAKRRARVKPARKTVTA